MVEGKEGTKEVLGGGSRNYGAKLVPCFSKYNLAFFFQKKAYCIVTSLPGAYISSKPTAKKPLVLN